MDDQPKSSQLLSPIRHSHTLPDGRILAYYTFATGTEESQLETHHPVLYLHGFPGSGVEGTICASAAAKAKCKLFALDRPGFGWSSPSPAADWNSPDAYMRMFVQDVWDFVRTMRWRSFSIVGVSGGGPYALALLDAYLTSIVADQGGDDDGDIGGRGIPCKLEAISIVAGVFCTAGVEGMMPQNKQLFSITSLPRGWKSMMAWYFLLFVTTFQRFMLLHILPEKWLMKSASPFMKDLPEVDRNVFLDDNAIQVAFLRDIKEALRQAASPAVLEARVLFRKGYYFEPSLRKKWKDLVASSKDYRSKDRSLPRVSMYQGHLDVNVPPSHSKYVHEQIFEGASRLVEYPSMGHLSLAVKKADEVLESVAATLS